MQNQLNKGFFQNAHDVMTDHAKQLENARVRLAQLEEHLMRRAWLAEPARANQFQAEMHAAVELLNQVIDDSESDELTKAQNVCETYVRRFLSIVENRLADRADLPPNEAWPWFGVVLEMKNTSFHQELCDELMNRITARIKELNASEEKRR